MYEDKEELYANKGFQLVTVKRSVALLNLAQRDNCTHLFTGTFHAYHLEQLEQCKPLFISPISEKNKEYENKCLDLYKNYLKLKERNKKLYKQNNTA